MPDAIPAPSSPHHYPDFPPGADRYERAERLSAEITELCAHINAATARLLELIVEMDGLEVWGAWGLASCAHWLNWRCGIGMNAAREKVRVAYALEGLPQIRERFRAGEVSYSKVRAMTRVATPENEAFLLMIAEHGTAAHMEKLVRGYRRVVRDEEDERARAQKERRELGYYWDDDGSLVVHARLPAEQGAVVLLEHVERTAELTAVQSGEGGHAPEHTSLRSAATGAYCGWSRSVPSAIDYRSSCLTIASRSASVFPSSGSRSARRYQ